MKRVYAEHQDHFDKEEHDTKQAFGHKMAKNIEIEPFEYPSVALSNARILKNIKRKKA